MLTDNNTYLKIKKNWYRPEYTRVYVYKLPIVTAQAMALALNNDMHISR